MSTLQLKIILLKLLLITAVIFAMINQTSAQDFEEISLSAFGVYQDIKIEVDKETKFKVQAAIKAEIYNDAAWAGIYARVLEQGESYGFYDSMSDRPITSDSWNIYEVEGTLTPESDTLSFGVQGFYTAKFYFDDVKLFMEDETGIFKELDLYNNGFENPMDNNILPYWDQYYIDERIQKPKQIFVQTSKESYSGKYSLLFDCSEVEPPIVIGSPQGADLQIGTLITMLEDLRQRVFQATENLDLTQTDYLFDDKANRIGALIMHLIAAEKYYQVFTFEGRSFNEEEALAWQTALDLGEKARGEIKGQSVDYYLDLYSEVRDETIRLLKTKDDEWLKEGAGRGNNHFYWFHVMEHQASHLGQIYFLKKRLPEKAEFKN